MKKNHVWVLVCIGFLVSGCGSSEPKHAYTEVNIEPEEKQIAVGDTSKAMMQDMPDDDIHAAFRKGKGMANTMANGVGNMPDDDIHKQFKSGGMVMDPALMNSVAPTSLSWTTPEGWQEEKGSGMRVATFKAGEGKTAVETSVISLAGAAGGMAANVTRWMGQLGMDAPSGAGLDEFLAKQEKITTASGLSVTIIDFTQLQTGAPADSDSMIAAVVEGSANQVFIKMTGSKEAVTGHYEAFKALVSSLKDGSGS